jgi:pimeloyl-ACP methyl ester carboxylesterase
VVLCHGLGRTHDEYLALALKLNEQGYAVALLNTRGQTATGGGSVTFGLREGLDVLAAADYLRSIPNVDDDRIAVIGSGVGGSAALHAAALDHSLAAVCADDVWPTLESFVGHGLQQRYVPVPVMTALYVMTFETMLRERSADGDLEQVMPRISQPALLLARTTPGAAPVADMVRLSALTNGPHDVVVIDPAANPDAASTDAVNNRVISFLNSTLHWTPPQTRASTKIQKLFDAQLH